MTREFTQSERIAYFTMEIALRSDIPTYSGGLGVLAGDTVRSAADLELPLVTGSLASRVGYFRQTIDFNGRQQEEPDPWNPAQFAKPVQARVVVSIEGRDVWVGGWLYVLESYLGGRQPVEARLRTGDPPVLVRVHEDRILLDLRTVNPPEDAGLLAALTVALAADHRRPT